MLKEAIILAGGLGTRMGNDSSVPKWATSIGETTIAEYQINWLRLNGIERILVTMSRRYQFQSVVPKERGPSVEVLWEVEPIGDEGGLKWALGHLEGDEALVVNCDVLTDLSLVSLPPAPALVVVHPRSPWGVLDPVTMRFEEKPLLDMIWVSAGIYRFPKALRDELLYRGELARHIVPQLLAEKRMSVLKYEGDWRAIETVKDAEEAGRLVN